MEKESVKKFDLEAAFKALDEIDIPVAEEGIKANRVDLKERFSQKSAHETLIEDYYDVSSHEDLEEAQDERDAEVAQAKLARIEKIVDLDAESPDDLLPSYVGKVIIQCPQCMTLFYKNPEDIENSEENPDVVNINEVCQHCGNTSGYTLIGKVGAVDESEADNYTEEPAGEESELDLDFEEPTEEVDAEGTGEGAEEMSSDEELSDDELKELELDLEEIPEEEPEEEKKEESLNLSKETSENETEHKSENLTLNEKVDLGPKDNVDSIMQTWSGSAEEQKGSSKELTTAEVDKEIDNAQKRAGGSNNIDDIVTAFESLNNSEKLKDAEEGSELKTENESENLTLNEEVDKDLDAKLKAHNDYIAYLQQMIKQEEESLKKAENDEIKAAIQRRLDAFNADLEAALPDAVKEEAPIPEVAEEPAVEEEPKEEVTVEETEEIKDEPVEEEAPVEEALTEDGAEEEKPAEEQKEEGNEVDYVEYKHSYCHALEPKLKAINYLVNVKKVEPKILKGYILKLLKDADIRWTEKEKEFKKNIEAKEDVYDILNYVKNSIEKAKTIKVKVDENGELVEGLNEGFEGCLYEVLTESLNKSEEAISEHESENNSENLTLNESAETEIDSIIASWGTNESLTEENDLDRLLDSPEFETPVSEAEIDAAREEAKEESLEECNKQELSEDIVDPEIDAIINSWEDAPEVSVEEACEGPECEEGYTGNPAERTTHLEYVDENPADGKAVLPDNIEKQLTEGEECKDGECEKPLEECGEKPLKEEDEVPAEEEASVEEPIESEEVVEEEPKEEEPQPIETTVEEVKEVATEVATEVVEEIAPATEDTEVVQETIEEVVNEVVEEKLGEEKPEEEIPTEAEEIPAEVEEPEFNEDDVDDLDECSLNKHIDEYLKEVYSNVKCFEATGCEFKDKKLFVEGKISFNSGKEKLTMFEFLPAYCEGKLFFEGYNKDFSEDKAFTLNCSINKSKTLITESFGYKYKINENLVEGLK